MTTPDFEGFKTRVQINEPQQGPKPVSQAGVKFDSKGREKKVEVKDDKKKEEEQSFFSKYWLYILGAMFILPRLLSPAEEGAAGSEGAAPAQGTRR
mmetsp:Transcript_22090/g.27168  ORF Transcript_22090/g.27168 Transcript_22090/m.27168 type:complete len:96 (+) Transcript_22090:579-866(+)|eukprot:CAMPEP_0170469736 /NCGR_PEP_ID=MMETSP0123-20130129/12466_1 /TAXON_ID=182087 /ORGANISM="Favella ehrenbergii, Strain Fehren 1" /LENGTH=95 /DNA_ID=CAMNT_0010736703 /DNA_START=581 /DNA_END=868 /DNA_ORIENTATION=+